MLRKHEDPPGILQDTASILSSDYVTEPAREPFRGNGRFQLFRQLGSGGFGTVHEAYDRLTGTVIALKVLNRPEAIDLMMFKREFRALADVRHPNIVKLYELIQEGAHWFFTMELVRGTDIVSYVAGSPERARRAVAQLAEAVRHLHLCDRLHRDIKPPNIRVTDDGEVKLLDFGMVRDISDESLAETATIGGTAAYMAPELWTGRSLKRSSDWYSVGVVLYEALTGQPPFEGSFLEVLAWKNQEPVMPPKALDAAIPDDLNELCIKLLDRDPSLRPDADAVIAYLAEADGRRKLAWSPETAPSTRPQVGREDQLAQLRGALANVRAGKTGCLYVDGPSGIGKTALCKRFLSEVRRQGGVVLSGRCYQTDSVPFKALDPILDSLGEHLKSLRSSQCAAFLPREQNLHALTVVFPALLAVDSIRQQHRDPTGKVEPRELQRRAVAGLKEILARIGERAACVVHVDDFQWGDLDSLRYFAEILGPEDPPRVLFVFSYRTEDSASVDKLKELLPQPGQLGLNAVDVRSLELAPLSGGECRELVKMLLDADADVVAEAIVRESAGLPLFIHELALHARSDAAMASGISLQDMIGQRVDHLPAPARRMLEVVSLAAQPVEMNVVRSVADLGDAEPSTRSLLLAHRLVRLSSSGAGTAIESYHDKIRETVSAGIPPARKRGYYRGLLVALEQGKDPDPEVTYRYAREAGDLQKAAQWIEIAAKRAESALAFELASELHAERLRLGGVSESQRSFLLEDLARTLGLSGKGDLAAETYQDAARGASPARVHQLIRKAGEQYIRSGDFAQGQALLSALLQRVGFHMPATGRRALASLLVFRMLLFLVKRPMLWLRGSGVLHVRNVPEEHVEKLDICRVTSLALALQNPVRSAELQARHLLYSLWLGEPYRIANSLAMEAGYLVARRGARGYPAGLKLLRRVEKLGAESGHLNGRTLALSVRCKLAWLSGRWEESAQFGEEVNRLATEENTQVAWEAYPSSIFWMCSLACMGRWREVISKLHGLRREGEAQGSLLDLTSLPVLTFAYMRWLLDNRPEGAVKELEEARNRLVKPGFIPHRFGVWHGLADLGLYLQDPEWARRAVEDGWEQLEQAMTLRLQPVRILMLHVRARAACAAAAVAGKSERTRLLEKAVGDARRIRKEGTVWGDGLSSLIEAGVAAGQGRFLDCLRLLNGAEHALLASRMDHFLAATRYRKAGLPDEFLDRDARAAAAGLAKNWFLAQRVENPERLIQMLSPGCWTPS
jgi:hypothetical protein